MAAQKNASAASMEASSKISFKFLDTSDIKISALERRERERRERREREREGGGEESDIIKIGETEGEIEGILC
jgi:hypothetical protein